MDATCKHREKGLSLRRLETFNAATLLGSPFAVILHDAVDQKYCAVCEEIIGHVIPKPNELLAVTALFRACNPTKLSGSDVRFLRKSLHLKAKEFAEKIDVTPEYLSRIENDHQAIGLHYERLLRMQVCIELFDCAHPSLHSQIKAVPRMDIKVMRTTFDPLVFNLSLELQAKSAEIPKIAEEDQKRYSEIPEKVAS